MHTREKKRCRDSKEVASLFQPRAKNLTVWLTDGLSIEAIITVVILEFRCTRRELFVPGTSERPRFDRG